MTLSTDNVLQAARTTSMFEEYKLSNSTISFTEWLVNMVYTERAAKFTEGVTQ